jgi:uncharacterized protein YbaR (Trm112 family)
MCSNGHSVCADCQTKVEDCPNCRGQLTRVRNRWAEDILDYLPGRPCRHECGTQLNKNDIQRHELICKHRTIQCPTCNEALAVIVSNFSPFICRSSNHIFSSIDDASPDALFQNRSY